MFRFYFARVSGNANRNVTRARSAQRGSVAPCPNIQQAMAVVRCCIDVAQLDARASQFLQQRKYYPAMATLQERVSFKIFITSFPQFFLRSCTDA